MVLPGGLTERSIPLAPEGVAMGATSGIDQLCINTMRTLAMDAVQKANSGHPGTPMSLAPVAYTLWQKFMHYDPDDANWPNRDRFVLSVGHASMLLYSLIHLTGIKAVNEHEERGAPALTLDDLKKFEVSAIEGHHRSVSTFPRDLVPNEGGTRT